MAVAPEHAMHVGDSYRADVMGARRLGIPAALIARGLDDPVRLRDEHSDPDLVVLTDLNDLLELFAIERPVASPA
jgi:FMN phosphatase YigB (HAD superfamily)